MKNSKITYLILFAFLFAQCSIGQNNIFEASKSGDFNAIKTYLKNSGNIDTVDVNTKSLLHHAVEGNQVKNG
jgi:hypothetical protein